MYPLNPRPSSATIPRFTSIMKVLENYVIVTSINQAITSVVSHILNCDKTQDICCKQKMQLHYGSSVNKVDNAHEL